jgi:hypothetical protein
VLYTLSIADFILFVKKENNFIPYLLPWAGLNSANVATQPALTPAGLAGEDEGFAAISATCPALLEAPFAAATANTFTTGQISQIGFLPGSATMATVFFMNLTHWRRRPDRVSFLHWLYLGNMRKQRLFDTVDYTIKPTFQGYRSHPLT